MKTGTTSIGSVILLWMMHCLGAVPQAQTKAVVQASIPMCKASDLSLSTDAENGSFNGMSHSGTLLVLRNLSPTPCRVPQRPPIAFLAGTSTLDVQLEVPGAKFLHPGPVLVPVVIAPDAEVTSKLRWVSNEVYADNVCVSPAAIAVTIGGQTQQASLEAHLCGERGKGVLYQATPLRADPTAESWTGKNR